MIPLLAAAGVVMAGVYLVCLGVVALARPAAASRFLLAHASSGPLHYLELGLRIAAGAAFLRHAPAMAWPALFTAFGWVLVVTSVLVMLVPWQWHQRFAQRSVTQALRYLGLIGLASLLLGGLVLFAALVGRA